MALANIYATVHPDDPGRLLVKVLDESGSDLDVTANTLTVVLWAAKNPGPLPSPNPTVPVKSVDAVVKKGPQPGFDVSTGFYDISLGSVTVDLPQGPGEVSVVDLEPTVYAIGYHLSRRRGRPVEIYGAAIVNV